MGVPGVRGIGLRRLGLHGNPFVHTHTAFSLISPLSFSQPIHCPSGSTNPPFATTVCFHCLPSPPLPCVFPLPFFLKTRAFALCLATASAAKTLPFPCGPQVPAAAVLGLNAGMDQEGGGNACVSCEEKPVDFHSFLVVRPS